MIKKNKFEKKIYNSILKSLPKKKYYPLSEPELKKSDKKHVMDCLNTGWVSSSGIYLDKFKYILEKVIKTKYIIPVINGTSALHLALIASEIKKNDEVIVPDLSYVSAANAVSYIGAIPNFVDADIDSYSICPIKLENYLIKISKKKNGHLFNKKTKRYIKAVILVHVFGYVGEIEKIKKICKKYNLKFIEDASECLGSYYKNQHLGTFGDFGVLSFNGNKIITTGGGGAVISNSKKKSKLIDHLSKNSKIKHQWKFYHNSVGYNYRLSNLSASLGYSQILRLNQILKKRSRLYNRYKSIFSKIEGVKIYKPIKESNPNHWLISFKLDDKLIKFHKKILNFLNKNKVYSRPAWELMSSLPMYKNCPSDRNFNAKKIQQSVICLPSSL